MTPHLAIHGQKESLCGVTQALTTKADDTKCVACILDRDQGLEDEVLVVDKHGVLRWGNDPDAELEEPEEW